MISSRTGGSYRSLRNAFLPVSIRNEIHTSRVVRNICKHMLSLYSTTLEEDLELLRPENIEKVPLYSNRRNALIHVRGEKEVLHHFLGLAECCLNLLCIAEDMDEEFIAQIENIRMNQSPLIYQYCKNSIALVRKQEAQRIELIQKNLDLSRPTIV